MRSRKEEKKGKEKREEKFPVALELLAWCDMKADDGASSPLI
jgi:hypothetical protein